MLGALVLCQPLAGLEPMRLFEEQQPTKCPFTDPVDMAGCSSQPLQTPLGCEQGSQVHKGRCFSKDTRKDRLW